MTTSCRVVMVLELKPKHDCVYPLCVCKLGEIGCIANVLLATINLCHILKGFWLKQLVQKNYSQYKISIYLLIYKFQAIYCILRHQMLCGWESLHVQHVLHTTGSKWQLSVWTFGKKMIGNTEESDSDEHFFIYAQSKLLYLTILT